jgi:hypothetical protein
MVYTFPKNDDSDDLNLPRGKYLLNIGTSTKVLGLCLDFDERHGKL